MRTKAFYCDSDTFNAKNTTSNVSFTTSPLPNYTVSTERTSSYEMFNSTVINNDSSGEYSEKETYLSDVELYKRTHHYSEYFNEPNTALLSTILIFGTFLIAYFLRIFRNSKFLGRSVSIYFDIFQ